jgi:hypothetical protein
MNSFDIENSLVGIGLMVGEAEHVAGELRQVEITRIKFGSRRVLKDFFKILGLRLGVKPVWEGQ